MAGGDLFTAEDDAEILRIHRKWNGARGWAQEAARSVKRRPQSVTNRMAVLRAFSDGVRVATLSRSVGIGQHGVEVLAPLETEQEPEDQFLARVLKATGQSVSQHKAERYARVVIESDRPIGLSISSDWHLTADGPTDVAGVIAHAETVRDTPAMYALAVGDQMDNPIKHQPQDVKGIPADLRLLDIVLGRFGGKLLGMTSGNHDDWTKTLVGVDNIQSMAERHALHYAPDELLWLVEIVRPGTDEVTARWVVATRHQYRRHSNLNHTHACWRWLEEDEHNWPNDEQGRTLLPDVVAIGHNHVAATETRSYQRGDVIACRMGSFQYTSRFTRQRGFTLMPPTCPTVILPNVRDGSAQPEAYARYEAAARVLRGYAAPHALPSSSSSSQREKQHRKPARKVPRNRS